MRQVIVILISLGLLCVSSFAMAKGDIKVSFISCCYSKGFFWPKVEAFMGAVADDLAIDLEVVYADMNHIRMKQLAEQIANRKNPPDYLLIDNYKLMAGRMIESLKATKVKVFLMANGLTQDQIAQYGMPREKFPNWIGELTPDNFAVGYQMARLLIDRALAAQLRAEDGRLHLVALAGDNQTPAGLQRVQGLKAAVSGYPDVILNQVIPCNWQAAEARKKIPLILYRYPKTAAIWAANDEMALGAMAGVVAAGKRPGTDIFFGGINWKKEALKKIVEGSMVASGGGHFMIGGWSLILLYDYHNGKDFNQDNPRLRMRIFDILDDHNVDRYLSKFEDENWSKIDFTKFSKSLNPFRNEYNFSLNTLLDH